MPHDGPEPHLEDLSFVQPEYRRDVEYRFQAQRKRRIGGQPVRTVETTPSIIETAFPDAATVTIAYSWVMPFDWVFGTPLEFHATFLQVATAATPNMIWRSSLGLERLGGTWSDTNLENVFPVTTGLTQNIATEVVRGGVGLDPTISALLTGSDKDYELKWKIERSGGHVDDTINGTVFIRHVWLEYYSTYDYQNLIND